MTGSALPPALGPYVEDEALLDRLSDLWERVDPVPPGLAERVCFALELENLDAELAELEESFGLVGARSEEQTRTLTFTSLSLSVMVTFGGGQHGGRSRLDGWIADGGVLEVLVHTEEGPRRTLSDEDGRFAMDDLGPGSVRLEFRSTEGSSVRLARPVVTPSVRF